MSPMRILLTAGLFIACLTLSAGGSPASEPVIIDPSGEWYSQIGTLSLMLTGDALSFSYSAVFGPSAHTCDGAGVAGLVTNGRYEYEDDSGGTIAFLVETDAVRMTPAAGIISFCGANWAGDIFTKAGYHPAGRCSVIAKRAYFHVVDRFPPERRRAYVIEGDPLDVVPVKNEGGDDYVLARFKGSTSTTVGLIRRADLSCGD